MQTVSCMCVGDPHFKTNNIQEVEKMTKKIIELVEKKKPTFVVVLGDILDTHETVHEAPFNKAIFFLSKLTTLVPTFLLIGNHDYCNNSQFQTTRHPFNACKRWKNMHVVDKAMQKKILGHTFFFCPYVPPGRFEEALETTGENWKSARCIFAHQEFRGCKMGPITSTLGDEWKKEYPLVISGHIHDSQVVGKNVYYTGSAMQHAFGDSERKGIWYVEFCDLFESGWKYSKFDLGLKKKKMVYLDAKDAMNEIPVFDKTKEDLKVVIKGTSSDFAAFRKSNTFAELQKKSVKVAFSQENEEIPEKTKQKYEEILSELLEKESENVRELWKQMRE